MVFGKIEYLNLLPFHVFMKRFSKNSQESGSMNYYKGVPSKINQRFQLRKVDAAFISSIGARGHKHVNLGIIAKKEVLSVLVIPNKDNIKDSESATSNVLASILDVQGEVLIGDKALKYYLEGNEYIDLASEWEKKFALPFVFAVLCYHKDKKRYKQIEKKFLHAKVKIPQYILIQAAQKTDISKKDILHYLGYISYNLDIKSKLGLRKFYNKVTF